MESTQDLDALGEGSKLLASCSAHKMTIFEDERVLLVCPKSICLCNIIVMRSCLLIWAGFLEPDRFGLVVRVS